MREKILMPQLGESVTAGTLVGWLKHPGDYIEAREVLFEVETDKATLEVEAETSGYVRKIGSGYPLNDKLKLYRIINHLVTR